MRSLDSPLGMFINQLQDLGGRSYHSISTRSYSLGSSSLQGITAHRAGDLKVRGTFGQLKGAAHLSLSTSPGFEPEEIDAQLRNDLKLHKLSSDLTR